MPSKGSALILVLRSALKGVSGEKKNQNLTYSSLLKGAIR
jgi:hypothetical protein